MLHVSQNHNFALVLLCWFQLPLKINVLKSRREEKVINIKKLGNQFVKSKKEINSVASNEASTKSHSLEDESQSSEGEETGNQKRSGPKKWKYRNLVRHHQCPFLMLETQFSRRTPNSRHELAYRCLQPHPVSPCCSLKSSPGFLLGAQILSLSVKQRGI